MAHEIMQHDHMISIRQTPWHGLGDVLPEYVTAAEAQRLAKLEWTVRKEPIYYRMPAIDGMSRTMQVPSQYAIVRDDNNYPLGIVGEQYEPYQNDAMFAFMDGFMQNANSKIETCGSLRNGKVVWALAQAGTTEHIKNDPTNEYFLFKNGFDGGTNIEICFTNVRVVCNNTLTAALSQASNTFRIRHTQSLYQQVDAVQQILTSQRSHAEQMAAVMAKLTKRQLSSQEIQDATVAIVTNAGIDAEDLVTAETVETAQTRHQTTVINTILDLHETGAGSDIKGVRGTAYGLLHACTEYADHFRAIRNGNRSFAEARFESIMMGSAHQFKQRALDHMVSVAA